VDPWDCCRLSYCASTLTAPAGGPPGTARLSVSPACLNTPSDASSLGTGAGDSPSTESDVGDELRLDVDVAENEEDVASLAGACASAARFWARRILRSGNFLIMACAVLCSSSRALVHMYLKYHVHEKECGKSSI